MRIFPDEIMDQEITYNGWSELGWLCPYERSHFFWTRDQFEKHIKICGQRYYQLDLCGNNNSHVFHISKDSYHPRVCSVDPWTLEENRDRLRRYNSRLWTEEFPSAPDHRPDEVPYLLQQRRERGGRPG